jgi:hypothetical protein
LLSGSSSYPLPNIKVKDFGFIKQFLGSVFDLGYLSISRCLGFQQHLFVIRHDFLPSKVVCVALDALKYLMRYLFHNAVFHYDSFDIYLCHRFLSESALNQASVARYLYEPFFSQVKGKNWFLPKWLIKHRPKQ